MSLHLHVFSGEFAILLPNPEEEVYRIDQIKEFEYISQVYKDWIGEILERGNGNIISDKISITKLVSKVEHIGRLRDVPMTSLVSVLKTLNCIDCI